MLKAEPGLFWPGFFVLLAALSFNLRAAEVFSRLEVHASSEPVPVYDMVNGWNSRLQRGSYAYADTRLQVGAGVEQWTLAYEQRGYYYLAFAPDTAEFYYNLEQGIDGGRRYRLNLDVQTLNLTGLRVSRYWQWQDVRLESVLTYYRVHHYQIGSLQGFADGSGSLAVSAELDYYFDEDKLLEYPADPGAGYGISTDLNLSWRLERWQLALQLRDLWNRIDLQQAAFTRGCINLSGSGQAVCESSGAASGVSGHENIRTHIPVTLQAQAAYTPWDTSLSVYQHERYQRISAQKNWPTRLGVVGVSAHSTRQLGLHWRSRWHEISVVSDDVDWQQARELQVQLALRAYW